MDPPTIYIALRSNTTTATVEVPSASTVEDLSVAAADWLGVDKGRVVLRFEGEKLAGGSLEEAGVVEMSEVSAAVKPDPKSVLYSRYYGSEEGRAWLEENLAEMTDIIDEDTGRNAVHVAVMADDGVAVGMVVKWGASPSLLDKNGKPPLHYATSVATVRALAPHVDLSQRDSVGRTALHTQTHPPAASELILLGSDFTSPAPKDTLRTPLHTCAKNSSLGTLKVILANNPDLNPRDASGATPLMYAVTANAIACVAALLEAGADPNIPDNKGVYPRAIARQGYMTAISDMFVKRNARGQKEEAYLMKATSGCPSWLKWVCCDDEMKRRRLYKNARF